MKTLITIIIILVVVIGGWLVLRSNDGTEVVDTGGPMVISDEFGGSPNKVANTVTYTNNGFSPATLIIGTYDTVVFVNESDEPLWVASDPHPTHTNLPSFDEKAAILKGGTYNHTFETPGTWSYHNHVGSSHRGTIIVQ